MGSIFGKIARGVGKAVMTTARSGIVKNLPVVGTAATVLSGASALGLLGGGGGSNLPMLPASGGLGGVPMGGGFAGGFPALPGSAAAPPIVGSRSVFRDDPNIAEALKAWAISARFLKTAFRSPIKGYVIVRDVNSDPFALPKKLAVAYAGYKTAKKPPISVGEHQALLRADRTVKKVRKIMAMVTRVDNNVGKGGKVKIRRKKS